MERMLSHYRRKMLSTVGAVIAGVLLVTGVIPAQEREDRIVRESSAVLREVMAIPLREIPASLLADADGIAIVPNVLKGSFVVGARHGKGVLLVREPSGRWQAPSFISLTGGNVGWQIGVQSTDVVLVFRTAESVRDLLSGKFTVGGDAAVAAGPVGRNVSAATDVGLTAEVLSYSRSRGLFAGVSLDGTVISIDRVSNSIYYPPQGSSPTPTVPPAALSLIQQIASLAGPPEQATVASTTRTDSAATGITPNSPAGSRQAVDSRGLLATLSERTNALYALLEGSWRAYFDVPQEILRGEPPRDPSSVIRCLQRFEAIRSNPQYRTLADRPEFQAAHAALRQYAEASPTSNQQLNLPPPPVR